MIGRQEQKEVEKKFQDIGFDRVYGPDTDLDAAIQDLKNDLKKKGKM
jgi:methylaspartate mutase sigma subunit